ncbi:MAG: HD domain-containing phosphohydrolase [Candidatus Omnitrophota bacterium]|nr:HD domain-containing protein [Candidatus Omnitrophota bacterium]
MYEIIEKALRDFSVALQVMKIYTQQHPLFAEAITRAHDSFERVLVVRDEFVVGIVGDELACDKEIFFDLSKKIKGVIQHLSRRHIERLVVSRGVSKEELIEFIAFIALPEEKIDSYVAGGKDLQDYLSSLGVKNISIGKIKGFRENEGAGDGLSSADKAFYRYERSLEELPGYIDTLLSGEGVDYLQLRTNIVDVMEGLLSRYSEFLKLSAAKKYDLATFIHLLNTSILSMYFSSQLGFTREDVLDVGIAALFHDIGKIYLSRIIKKPKKLTDEEYRVVQSHTSFGAEFLLKYVDTMGILPFVVALEHHRGYDLSGYPKTRFAHKPHVVSLIVSICDVYDALTQRRTYKRDYPPNMIYDIMMKKKGDFFDPNLLERFFASLGIWPKGTIVRLVDGRIGIVREQNPGDIWLPKVEIISEGSQRELIDLWFLKDSVSIEGALNPLVEGAAYLNLI